MHRAHRYVASLLLTAALTAPVAILAATPHQEGRVYDKEHKDYHRWDDKENEAWRRFLAESAGKITNLQRHGRKSRPNIGIGATAIPTKPGKVSTSTVDAGTVRSDRKTSWPHRLTFYCPNRNPSSTD
jgi:hypothetical protein